MTRYLPTRGDRRREDGRATRVACVVPGRAGRAHPRPRRLGASQVPSSSARARRARTTSATGQRVRRRWASSTRRSSSLTVPPLPSPARPVLIASTRGPIIRSAAKREARSPADETQAKGAAPPDRGRWLPKGRREACAHQLVRPRAHPSPRVPRPGACPRSLGLARVFRDDVRRRGHRVQRQDLLEDRALNPHRRSHRLRPSRHHVQPLTALAKRNRLLVPNLVPNFCRNDPFSGPKARPDPLYLSQIDTPSPTSNLMVAGASPAMGAQNPSQPSRIRRPRSTPAGPSGPPETGRRFGRLRWSSGVAGLTLGARERPGHRRFLSGRSAWGQSRRGRNDF